VKKIASQSYLLLELIIALTLVMLCVLPYLRIPSGVVRQELLFIQRLELQHVSDRTCALVKERIYTGEISWEQICHPKEKKVLIIDDIVSLPIKELAKQRYSRRCYLYSCGKKGPNNEEYRLVTVKVLFKRIPAQLSFFANPSKKSLRFPYQFFLTQEKQKTD
jgi:hypothetical protein